MYVLMSALTQVIVRRVVAARQTHAAGMAALSSQGKNGLQSHGAPPSRSSPYTSVGTKEAADMTDFPERPGAKKTKRGGFWARFRCW